MPISCSALPLVLQHESVLWRLLTSVRSACPHGQGYEISSPSVQISPGKNAIFLSIYLLHLLSHVFGSMDFGLFSNLIQRMLALYEVRVPQTGDLPQASFRFHLAEDTLALS
ncbi:hypothetical protein H1230_16755 [Paenibacillus sp. 19GGS1-52]|uniref:hypothetical protein n=1 Tax=Paenibacillus sp. 19GGS1-52 TaxID=2758563 RepID=UPI001EFA5E43|nr:hypothetical protein [Paenibacillus sp. 19GGS1-52]ULO10637.1 hypothetical protein H1230_16755 [Paenibacillus sp. 19GGS1-52]